MRFTRAEGLGNDYVVLETDPGTDGHLSPAGIRLLCDRHRGIGGDGLLVPIAPTSSDFRVRIFNPDGSEAEKSGNGLRIFARYLRDTHGVGDTCTIETVGGVARVQFLARSDGTLDIAVDMGRPEFRAGRVPLRCGLDQAVEVSLPLSEDTVVGTAVSVGNPHWVVFCDDVRAVPIGTLGPEIEHHPWFPNRTNVQFAHPLSRDRVRVRIWERGAGETLASGSSACAVVAAGIRTGRFDQDVEVEMDGGTLKVRAAGNGHLWQRGPVNVIATGVVAQDLERQLRGLPGS